MEPSHRRDARRRLERIQHFRQELAELEQAQVLALGDEQRARLNAHLERELAELRSRFDLDVSESGERISLGVRIAALLGGAAFFVALVLFLDRIWGALPQASQVAVLVAAPLLPLAVAEILFRRGAHPYFTTLFAVAAVTAFALELDTLRTVLNMAPHPHLLLALGVFAMLVAHAYGSRLALAAGLACSIAYAACLLVACGGEYWGGVLERSETLLPAAAVVYVAPSVVRTRHLRELGSVWRACGAATALFAVLLLSLMGRESYLPFHDRTSETLYQVVGLILGAGLITHAIRLGSRGLVNLGAGAFVVFLYVKLHAWWWAWMPKYLFFLAIGLIAVALLIVFRTLRSRMSTRSAV